ncbi:MAG: SUMF1/EgtB/PvdO family nonheme iron enzyme, partial [Chloroflexota bacterium]
MSDSHNDLNQKKSLMEQVRAALGRVAVPTAKASQWSIAGLAIFELFHLWQGNPAVLAGLGPVVGVLFETLKGEVLGGLLGKVADAGDAATDEQVAGWVGEALQQAGINEVVQSDRFEDLLDALQDQSATEHQEVALLLGQIKTILSDQGARLEREMSRIRKRLEKISDESFSISGDYVAGDKISAETILNVSEIGNENTIAQGDGATAVNKRGVAFQSQSSNSGVVNTGDNVTINLGVSASSPDQPTYNNERRSYLNWVIEQTGRLPLEGIDPGSAADTADTRLALDAVYTALMVKQLEQDLTLKNVMARETDRSISHIDEVSGRFMRQCRSALETLNEAKHLVLMGNPGAGKSTFVNFVALCMAGAGLGMPNVNLKRLTEPLPMDDEGRLRRNEDEEPKPQRWDHGPLIPVRIILRDLAARGLPQPGKRVTHSHLLNFLKAELKDGECAASWEWLEMRLKLGVEMLLLFDGLDEVNEADRRREQIKQLVQDVARTWNGCRILVTSRTYAYQQQAWQLDHFAEAELDGLTTGQIKRFITGWYAHLAAEGRINRDTAEARAQRLENEVLRNPRLLTLAEKPILLTLIAAQHAWHGRNLPEKRDQLYEQAVDLLLDRWERRRLADQVGDELPSSLSEWLQADKDEIRSLLQALAFDAHQRQTAEEQTPDVPQKDLVDGLMAINKNPDARPLRLIEYLRDRAGLLLPRGDKVYSFPHRTFQEYLAACHLTASVDYPDNVAPLVRSEPDKWREVALLAAARSAKFPANLWAFAEVLCRKEPPDFPPDSIENPSKCDATEIASSWGAHLAAQALVESANLTQVADRNKRKIERISRWLVHLMGRSALPAYERALAGAYLDSLGDPRDFVTDIDQTRFCYVPPGPFMLGEPGNNDFYRCDLLDYGYWIGQFPITNGQYHVFVKDDGYLKADFWLEAAEAGYWEAKSGYRKLTENYDAGSQYNRSNLPVVAISWYEALAFARWLTRRWLDMGKLLEGWQVQLPNEPEWEKAARGGLDIPAKPIIAGIDQLSFEQAEKHSMHENRFPERVYTWPDGIDSGSELLNVKEADINRPSSPGCFPKGQSPYGCQDMLGNVDEWIRTMYGNESNEKFQLPYDLTDGSW